ncbi:hypothetical protein [Pseudomonas sp.]|jgi:hypothetical protein|uniref:hypothetical protein n=1 Tax=Pseudomonas sp. TaxID=306 RepID=UPI003265483E
MFIIVIYVFVAERKMLNRALEINKHYGNTSLKMAHRAPLALGSLDFKRLKAIEAGGFSAAWNERQDK